jgi:hypothetical protein
MPRVGFESTIPVFEREKMVHALDRAATVIGKMVYFYKIVRINLRRRLWFVHRIFRSRVY